MRVDASQPGRAHRSRRAAHAAQRGRVERVDRRSNFELAPHLVSVAGMVRFYLRSAHAALRAVREPREHRSARPAQPIAFPAELCQRARRRRRSVLYGGDARGHQGALRASCSNRASSWRSPRSSSRSADDCCSASSRSSAKSSGAALLFFYFSTIDQRHHMLARQADPQHPFHAADTPPDLAAALADSYAEIDGLVGRVMERMDRQTDAGRDVRSRLRAVQSAGEPEHVARAARLSHVAGSAASATSMSGCRASIGPETRAFAIGLNSLYLNVRGRERYGIVPLAQRGALAREIAKGCSEWRDLQPASRRDAAGPARGHLSRTASAARRRTSSSATHAAIAPRGRRPPARSRPP